MSGIPPGFLFFPKDFVSDPKVSAMSTVEVGAYILLLCKAWYEKPAGSVPDDDRILAKWVGMTRANWLRAKPSVMAAWELKHEVTDEKLGESPRWFQKRLCSEFMIAKEQAATRAEKATKAAKSRWEEYKKNMPEECSEHATSNAYCIPVAMLDPCSEMRTHTHTTPIASSFPHSSEKEEANSFCAETKKTSSAAPDDSPILLAFPCDGGKQCKDKTWNLTEAQLAEWKELFPSLDLLAECRKALAWVKADPARHKTAKGMKKFLVGWFGRAQDNGHANGNGKQKARESFRDRGILRGTPEQEAAEARLIAQVLGGAPDEEEGFGWPE